MSAHELAGARGESGGAFLRFGLTGGDAGDVRTPNGTRGLSPVGHDAVHFMN
jgi:hypothetical protein